MHDMIGASGMLQGWATVWHMELVWLLAMLVVSVATTSLIESLITTLRPHLLAPKQRQAIIRYSKGCQMTDKWPPSAA